MQETRLKSRSLLPVLALRIEVLDGPDRGRVLAHEGGDLAIGTAQTNALVLTDPTVSRFHVEIGLRKGRIRVSDPGSTNGTRIGPVVLRSASVELDAGAELILGDTHLRVSLAQGAGGHPAAHEPLGQLLATSPTMKQALADLARVAKSDVSVLLHGESGTGKEVAARAIHDGSPRADQPFVTIDCASIAPQLVASQLFGHERGAFTGADRRRIGAFEQANGGTLFLDEVGELTAEHQAMLLGVLERRRFSRLGGHELVNVDVRIVSATHRDLRAAVNAGTFRLDLYYRLAPVRVALPPLRDRLEDLRPLIQHFLNEMGAKKQIEEVFEHEDLVAMERHAWPGNIRELRNVVEATLALGRATLEPVSHPTASGSFSLDDSADEALYDLDYKVAKREILDRFESRYLRRLLDRSNGSIRAASRESKLERNHLTELLRRHRLHPGTEK